MGLAYCVLLLVGATIATSFSTAAAAGFLDFGGDIALPPAKRAEIRTLGVVAALPDHLTFTHIGTTVFSNSEYSLDISQWALNAVMRAAVVANIDSHIAIEQATSAEGEAFAAAANGRLFHSPTDQMRDLIRALPQQDVDAYLVVAPTTITDPTQLTSFSAQGFGVMDHVFITHRTDFEYAAFYVWLFDAHTGALLARAEPCIMGADGHCDQLWVRADDAVWADSADQLSDIQRQRLQRDFLRFAQEGMNTAIHGLGLSASR